MEVQAYEHTCDGCDKVVIARTGDEVLGLLGQVIEISEYGGHTVEWWACSRKCVGKAVINALER